VKSVTSEWWWRGGGGGWGYALIPNRNFGMWLFPCGIQGHCFIWQMSVITSCRHRHIIKNPAELRHVTNCVFVWYGACLRVEGKQFQHFFWIVVTGINWTRKQGPRPTAECNSGRNCAACRHVPTIRVKSECELSDKIKFWFYCPRRFSLVITCPIVDNSQDCWPIEKDSGIL